VVIDRPVYEGPPQKLDALQSQYLLFESCLDGDRDEYLESMRTLMRADADAVWEHCVGYPGSSDAEGFAGYFRRNQIDASLFMAAYPKATVDDVRVSLTLRQQVIDFAVATQASDAPTLLAAYRKSSWAAARR
jgi:hypothetical protein